MDVAQDTSIGGEQHDLDASTASQPDDKLVPFQFSRQPIGQYVAVFYDDTFHVGVVDHVSSAVVADVCFMRRSTVDSSIYIWPVHDDVDVDTIDSIMVFASDFDVSSVMGRT